MLSGNDQLVVIVVEKGLEGGGIGRSMGYVMDSWAAAGTGPNVKLIDPRGTGSILLSPLHLLSAMASLAWLRLLNKIALVHVNVASRGSTWRNLILIFWVSLLHIPVVTHLHGASFAPFLNETPRFLRRAIRWMFERSQRIIVLGESWADLLVNEVGVTRSRIRVIYNGVPRPLETGGTAQTNDIPHILFLGILGQRKGVHDLLTALADPETSKLSWNATLAGNGDVSFFKDMAASLRLSERVSFPGWVGRQETDKLLHQADMLVLPSYAEGLPMSVLEGLAYKIPVVTTPVGAVPELLKNGETALLVSPGDTKNLALAIQALIKDKALRQKIGANGLGVFNDKIEVSIVAKQVAALYAEVLCG